MLGLFHLLANVCPTRKFAMSSKSRKGRVSPPIWRNFRATDLYEKNIFSDKVYDRMLKIRANNERPKTEDPEPVKAVNLNQSDLPSIVMGKEGDPIIDRPFLKVFTRERIKKAWDNVGSSVFGLSLLSTQ